MIPIRGEVSPFGVFTPGFLIDEDAEEDGESKITGAAKFEPRRKVQENWRIQGKKLKRKLEVTLELYAQGLIMHGCRKA